LSFVFIEGFDSMNEVRWFHYIWSAIKPVCVFWEGFPHPSGRAFFIRARVEGPAQGLGCISPTSSLHYFSAVLFSLKVVTFSCLSMPWNNYISVSVYYCFLNILLFFFVTVVALDLRFEISDIVLSVRNCILLLLILNIRWVFRSNFVERSHWALLLFSNTILHTQYNVWKSAR